MTIRQAIDNGTLPNVEESFYVDVCKTLGMHVDNLDYELKEGELNRLKYNSRINVYYATERVQKAHNKLIDNYGKLIEKYEKLSEEMTEDYLEEDKLKIEELLDKLRIEKANYEEQNANINLNRENMNLDNKVLNKFQEKRLDTLSAKEEKIDKKLQAEYDLLNRLQSNEYKTKFMQRRNERNIKSVQNRIARLQRKQGRLQNTQQRIINKGTRDYRRIKQQELRRDIREIKTIVKDANRINEIKEQQENYASDIETKSREIEEYASTSGILNKFRLRKLESEKRRMERRLNGLNVREAALNYIRSTDKEIKCDFRTQLFRNVTRAYAYSR